MAKRYHNSKKARRNEHMGMERYERGPLRRAFHAEDQYDDFYNDRNRYNDRYYNNEGVPNHRSQKYNDEKHSDKDFSQEGFLRNRTYAEDYMGMPVSMRSGLEKEQNPMIREDHRAIANLPQEVMIKAYPMTGPYMPEDLDDTGRAVDAQMDYDDEQRRAHFYPKKH